MQSLIEPNIHPILVHFAYALSITSVVCYLLSGFSGARRESLRMAADWMLAFGALAIVATIAAGFQAYYSVGHDGPSHAAMTTHRNWAVPSGTAILILAAWRWIRLSKPVTAIFKVLLTVAAISLSVTAWWGGHIVYNYGLGVKSLPVVTGDGHDHDHGDSAAMADVADDSGHDNADGHHDDMAAQAANRHDNSDGHHDAAKADMGTALAVVEAFEIAMSQGDSEALSTYILPTVVIAEGGGAERSLEEYAGHHMPADMAFMKAVTSTLKKRDVIETGDMATIISETQIHGTFKDKKIHNRSMETMVLQRQAGEWKISHIHWSSSPITGEHEH